MTLPAKQVREHIERRYAERVAEAEPLVRALRAKLPEAAEILRSRFGATRVLLFGSFARGTPRPGSDVDIAVVGVAGPDHFRAMSVLEPVLGRPVDLVLLEELEPARRERILREAEQV
jgi:predicted nucleotidyltransferase